jgi:hypothetical protein
MKKINKIAYNKLLLQAEEAKDRGLTKLSSAILYTIGSHPEDEGEDVEYAYEKLHDDLYQGLWKLVGNIIKYYDLESVDVRKIDSLVEYFSQELLNEAENTFEVESVVAGPFEPKVPGELK